MFLTQFQHIGRCLFSRGLVSSSSGNLSMRIGDKLIITRRGSNLEDLQEKDLIETGIDKNCRSTPLCSVELPVHRAIYRDTLARAIVHAHPPHATALSMAEKTIASDHLEDFCGLGPVPVVGWGMEVRPGSMPDIISQTLKNNRIVAVHGHGTFAIGQLMDEAFNYTTGLEEACEILCIMKSIGASASHKEV